MDAREADASDSAPWSPVPTSIAREFVRDNEDAQLEVVFPTVYEEDRTAKLKDLITAQAAGSITHQRMSEQVAKELGFEEYDYTDELDAIEEEMKNLPKTILGVADQIAGAKGDTGGDPASGAAGGAPGSGMASDRLDTGEHRFPLSGVAQSRFKRQQQ